VTELLRNDDGCAAGADRGATGRAQRGRGYVWGTREECRPDRLPISPRSGSLPQWPGTPRQESCSSTARQRRYLLPSARPGSLWRATAPLNLSDEDVDGGEEDNVTVGINWYPTPNFRFMANYVRVLDLEGSDFDGAEPDAFLLRAQAYW
jgi:hypothetical protein